MPVVTIDDLRERLLTLFLAAGLGARETGILVEIILDAEASGRRTHGLIRVRPMLRQLGRRPHCPGTWIKEDAASALYDGAGGLGYLVAYECTLKAVELTRGASIVVVGARGATHTGPLGYFARMCALEGLIGLCLANCSPMAAPFGATSPVLGTNPVTLGFPAVPEPVVVDLATTAATYGDCRVALAEGRLLPEGVALDSRGEPTRDPRAAIEGGCLLPFGGHKGYALALAVQILTSAFTGAAAVPRPGTDYGYLVLALRKELLVPEGRYDELVAEILQAVKIARPADPEQPVRLPGERSAANRRRAFRQGLELTEALYRDLFGETG